MVGLYYVIQEMGSFPMSVANNLLDMPQCGGSGMFIPDPEFYLSRIPDLGSRIPDLKTAVKDICEKKLVVIPFFWSHKFHKIDLFYF